METNITEIKIGFSCTQDWSMMDPLEGKRFCHSCTKEVVDFSILTTEEIIDYFESNRGRKTCGKFGMNQLAEINASLGAPQKKKNKLLKAMLLLGSFMITSCSTTVPSVSNPTQCKLNHGVTITEVLDGGEGLSRVEGVVLENGVDAIIGASVIVGKNIVSTDYNGKFEMIIDQEIDSLAEMKIYSLGMSTVEIKLIDIKNKRIEVIMIGQGQGALLGDVIVVEPYRPFVRDKTMWERLTR